MKATLLLCLVAACGYPRMNTDPTEWNVDAVKPTTATAAALANLSIRDRTPLPLLAVDGIGDAGAINPAVLEYMFAAPGSPVVRYFAAWLAEGGDQLDSADVRDLRRRATALATPGAAPSPTEYARAWSQPVIAPLNRVLADPPTNTIAGAAEVWCCATVDPQAPRLIHAPEVFRELGMVVVRNQGARVVMIIWHDDLLGGTLTWDTSRLPRAYDATASLDLATVAAAILPLHEEITP